MTLTQQPARSTRTWRQPDAVAPRGTLVLVPGRGEHPGVYERFGLRLAADGYPVHAVTDPLRDAGRAAPEVSGEIRAVFAADAPRPHVLVGSDSGALAAAALVASGAVPVDALVLAGLPVDRGAQLPASDEWEHEVAARTACPTHQQRLTGDPALRRGALRERLPQDWFDRATATAITVPVLGLHGADDVVSPFDAARGWYEALPAGHLVRISGGRHDALNDQTHRSAAATVVLFLERLRSGPDLAPIAVEVRRSPPPTASDNP